VKEKRFGEKKIEELMKDKEGLSWEIKEAIKRFEAIWGKYCYIERIGIEHLLTREIHTIEIETRLK
jgi:hypothetical protein